MALTVVSFGLARRVWNHDCEPNDEDCQEVHLRAFVLGGFERSLRGLHSDAWYSVVGASTLRHDSSYGSHNEFRRNLCRAALGVDPDEVWAHPDKYVDEPFFELIHFADNEGTIGPDAARDLANDFDEEAETVMPELDDVDRATYQWWRRATRLAENGLIDFR